MTKKHFEAIAELLATYNQGSERVRDIAGQITIDLAYYFKGQNPQFDKDRFYKAAGMKGF